MVSTLPNPNPERRLAALARILKLLRETEDLDLLVTSLLENLQEELHYDLLWFGLYERVQHQIMSQGYLAPKAHRSLRGRLSLAPGDLMEQVVIQQRPLIVNDLRIESRIAAWNEMAEQLDIQGALMFPVRRRDVCYGVLVLGSNQWGQTVSSSDRTFISTICSALADVLHKREQTLQTQSRKDPGIAVASLIDQLRPLTDRDDQLAKVAHSISQFVECDRVRIFWLDPLKFEFWERITIQARQARAQRRSGDETSGLHISATEIRGVYQALNNQQLLVIGEAQSSHTASVPDQFLKLLKASAIMVAPILERQTLLGFVSVERGRSQVWSEASRQYVTTVANVTGLMMPSLSVEEIRQQADAEVRLLTGLVRSIQNDTDWHLTLEKCSEEVGRLLGTEHFLVLFNNVDRGGYNIVFRKTPVSRKKIPSTWVMLDEVDWQMLEGTEAAIAINDLTVDLKLLAWRENFQQMQVQSLLAANVSPGYAPEGIVVIGSQTPRQWTPAEMQLSQKIAGQIGLILRQWQLQRQTNQQEDLYGSIQWGLRTLQQTYEQEKLEDSACQYLIDLMDAAMVVLLDWQVGQPDARVSRFASRHIDFTVDENASIPIGSDAVINWAQQTDGPLPVIWEDFPAETRQWITGPPESKFLLVALRTTDKHALNGVWIVADRGGSKWTDHHFSLMSLLSNQLAWSRRHLSVVDLLMTRQESLEALNWYKHKRLSETHRQLATSLERLNNAVTQGQELTAQRQLQLVRQLTATTKGIGQVVTTETWELHSQHQTTPLISLLNRLMERVNPLIKKHHLWAKVHNDSNVIITGDLEKIELVLYELVLAACERSPEQGRLDIWCRPLDRTSMELAITDDGDVPRQLLKDLKHGRPDDILIPSPLDFPPGLHLSICRTLMQQMGGEFSLQRLDDGRVMSRLVLAIAGKSMGLPRDSISSQD